MRKKSSSALKAKKGLPAMPAHAGQTGKKQMVSVSNGACFWVNNGPILCNLRDLEGALKRMSEDQFRHHVGKSKNDFVAWVKNVLSDADCAKGLAKAKDKKTACNCVSKALTKYK